MKLAGKGRMSGSMINDEQNLERYVILQTVLHFAGIAIQKGILEEKIGHPRYLVAPAGHWQCMLAELEGPGVRTGPAHKGFQCEPATLSPSKTAIQFLKALKSGIDLVSLR